MYIEENQSNSQIPRITCPLAKLARQAGQFRVSMNPEPLNGYHHATLLEFSVQKEVKDDLYRFDKKSEGIEGSMPAEDKLPRKQDRCNYQ